MREPMDLGSATARATLVVAPLLAFNVFLLPGIFTLAMTLPLIILVAMYFTTTGNRVPLWELSLLALLALSVLWGDDPNYSVERLRTYLPLLLATTFASCLLPANTILRCLELSFGVIVVSSLIYILLDPVGAIREGSPQLDVTAQFAKNTYGGLLGIALLLTIGHKRRINVLLVVGLVILIAVNRCVTAWVLLTFLVFATYVSRRLINGMGRGAKPVLAVMGLAGIGGAAVLALLDGEAVLAALGKDPTLSARTEIWAACWQQITRAPLLGHGAFTFLDPASNSPVTQFVLARFHNYEPPHPHNGFLDIVGQLGVLGAVVFAGLVLDGLKRGAQDALGRVESAHTAATCLIFISLFGVTEPTYLGPWLVITIMCVGIASSRGSMMRMPSSGPRKPIVHGEGSGTGGGSSYRHRFCPQEPIRSRQQSDEFKYEDAEHMSLQPNEAKDQANWNLRAYSGEPRLGPPSACSSRREPMPRIAGRIAGARLHLRLIGWILHGSAAAQPAHILTPLAHESLGWHLD